MPLFNHFHPPLHGPRRWEGLYRSWAAFIAGQLNERLPPGYFAEPEITLGANQLQEDGNIAVWSPPRAAMSVAVDFSHLDSFEVQVYQELDGVELRGAIELVSPANKDREGSRRTFAAKCAGYLQHGIGLAVIDVVTSRNANLHAELFDVLDVSARSKIWESPTGLSAVAYRPVTVRKRSRIEVWPEPLTLGTPLPTLPLWLHLDLCVPLELEQSYLATCRSLRIPA